MKIKITRKQAAQMHNVRCAGCRVPGAGYCDLQNPLHGLRHTSATLLIANNQDIRSVSARLGHAETSTTLNIYTHFLESTDKKSADILKNVLAKQA